MPVGQLSDGRNLALYLIGRPQCEEALLRFMYVDVSPPIFDLSPTDRPQVCCRGRLGPSTSAQADVRRQEYGINHVRSVRFTRHEHCTAWPCDSCRVVDDAYSSCIAIMHCCLSCPAVICAYFL